jgi:hypothetical protein
MNKTVTPKQLDLTAGKTREELLLATAPHIDTQSPAFKASVEKIEKIELAEAAQAVLSGGGEEEFNWNTDDSVILREQRATACYHNKLGELIIRQRAAWDDEGDTFIYVTPENANTLIDGIAARIRNEPNGGR